MNIVKYLQMLTEMGLLDWVPLEKMKKFEFLFGNFIITVFEMNKETKPRWVLEIEDLHGGLKELIGYHDRDNGYLDVCPLYHTIKANPKNVDHLHPHSDFQKKALNALTKELFCY